MSARRHPLRRVGRMVGRFLVPAALLLAVAPVAPANALPGYEHPPDPVAAKVDQFVAAQLEKSAIPGAAVAVTKGDQVLLVRGYGHDSAGAPITGDSLFRVASLSKSFTALAVMQLVDEGRLALDDQVQQHVPDFRMADPRSADVTVRDLLDQSSGITDRVVPDLSRRQPRDPADAVASLQSYRLATPPGATWSYANPNYQVAARVVEVVSGEPFATYLRCHVLRPAGMASTTSTMTDDQRVRGLPAGHVIAYGHAFRAPDFGSYTAADGGVVSSAADMARWLVVNTHGGVAPDGTRVVSGSGLERLHTPSAPGTGYALGWATHGPRQAPTRLEHSGSLLTYTAEQAIWPGTGYGVVLLFNSGSPMMLDQIAIAHGVFDIIEGTTPPGHGPRAAVTIDRVLAGFALILVTLGVAAVLRASRWVERRRKGSTARTVLGLVPSVLVLALGVVFPRLVETLVGRDVTWKVAAYTWPALMVLVATMLGAAASTLLARSWQWHRAHRNARGSDVRSTRDAVGVDGTDDAENAPSLVV